VALAGPPTPPATVEITPATAPSSGPPACLGPAAAAAGPPPASVADTSAAARTVLPHLSLPDLANG
jgi:hypothetical protein